MPLSLSPDDTNNNKPHGTLALREESDAIFHHPTLQPTNQSAEMSDHSHGHQGHHDHTRGTEGNSHTHSCGGHGHSHEHKSHQHVDHGHAHKAHQHATPLPHKEHKEGEEKK